MAQILLVSMHKSFKNVQRKNKKIWNEYVDVNSDADLFLKDGSWLSYILVHVLKFIKGQMIHDG